MDVQIADDLRAQAMAAIACWLRRDQEVLTALSVTTRKRLRCCRFVSASWSPDWNDWSARTRSADR